MTFTNISRRDLYMQCCHRVVSPGESFSLPWADAEGSRGVRAAMADGALAWEPDPGEPDIPGSPAVPERLTPEGAKARSKARAEAKARDDEAKAKALAERMKAADEGVKANMARMGHFDVPTLSPRLPPRKAAREEPPPSRDDVISEGDAPKSLADIVRHNRAVKSFVAKGGSNG